MGGFNYLFQNYNKGISKKLVSDAIFDTLKAQEWNYLLHVPKYMVQEIGGENKDYVQLTPNNIIYVGDYYHFFIHTLAGDNSIDNCVKVAESRVNKVINDLCTSYHMNINCKYNL